MTPAQITELEAVWEREIATRKSPWEAALACAEHAQTKRRHTTKRKVLKERLAQIFQIMREEYPEDAIHRIRPILEEIEKSL